MAGDSRPGKTQLVAVRVGDVEVPLSPLGIAGRGLGVQPVAQRAVVEGVNVADVKDDTSPPRPLPVGRFAGDVQIALADAEAGKGRVGPAIDQLETQRAIERDRTGHVVSGEGDRTDGLDGSAHGIHSLTASGCGAFARKAYHAHGVAARLRAWQWQRVSAAESCTLYLASRILPAEEGAGLFSPRGHRRRHAGAARASALFLHQCYRF